uniref:Uncharacterized protein n=1 Tax=Rhizophora mucronata TaxID=61149 RepID=A0A2P2QXE0_RHIMU
MKDIDKNLQAIWFLMILRGLVSSQQQFSQVHI